MANERRSRGARRIPPVVAIPERRNDPDPFVVRKGPEDRWPFVRDIILFLGGLGGVIHETLQISTGRERPTLLLVFVAMMGLPTVLPSFTDRRANAKDKD